MANYSLFRPRDRENNFILSVAMTTVKMLFFVVLLIGVAALGLGVGVGKAWVDTSPCSIWTCCTPSRRPRSSTTSTGN